MRRRLTAVLTAAAIAGAFAVPGCAKDDASGPRQSSPPPASASPSRSAAAQTAPLPTPAALATVLYRLADAAVPGSQKLSLVEGATPESAGVIDQFANALINGGFVPVRFDVRGIDWSDRDPADVVGNVDVSSTDPRGPRFGFPMEFKPYQGGWQLAARTADVLLAFRNDTSGPAATPGR
jgi:hypothetical protein